MGLFSFVKNAGDQLAQDSQAASLKQRIDALNLGIENVSVEVNDGHVILRGKAATQAIREKAILAVGNVLGVTQVEDYIEVTETAPEATFYTVVSGDSLSKIAKHFYGDASKYPIIFEANTPMLSDPNKIYPGQSLRIPPVA